LPREKAGVGSAIGNTVRQVAGALGIAILGSVLSAVYRSHIADHLTGVPANARGAAGDSISASYGVAETLAAKGNSAAGAIVHAANDSYVTAMHWASAGSAIVALIGVLVVLRWLPSRAPAVDPIVVAAAGIEPEALEETVEDELELAEA
jgi:hypothetical protein